MRAKGMLMLGIVAGLVTVLAPVQAQEKTVAPLTLHTEAVANWLTLDGKVEPVHQGTVAAQTSGRVVRMLVDVNDQVKEGQPLLEISGNEQSASVAAAQAALARAEAQQIEADRQLVRIQALTAKGVASKAQLDNASATARAAQASVKAAEAELAKAREAYGYTQILAPYAGVVTERHVELGETVAPGTPLLSGLSLDALRVVSELPQSALRLGELTPERIEVVLPSGRIVAPIHVMRFNYADATTHTFQLRLDLPAQTGDALPGTWVKVRIKQGERPALLIPRQALLRQGELSAVYLQGKSGWALTPVRVGREQGERVEILAGLQPGDQIASVAWDLLREVQHE